MSVEKKVEATVEAMTAHKSMEATVIAEYYEGLTATALPTSPAESAAKEASAAQVNSLLPTSSPEVIIKIVTPPPPSLSGTVTPVLVEPTAVPTKQPPKELILNISLDRNDLDMRSLVESRGCALALPNYQSKTLQYLYFSPYLITAMWCGQELNPIMKRAAKTGLVIAFHKPSLGISNIADCNFGITYNGTGNIYISQIFEDPEDKNYAYLEIKINVQSLEVVEFQNYKLSGVCHHVKAPPILTNPKPIPFDIPTSTPTMAPTPVPTPTVALYTQYTAALSELEPQYDQPGYESMWDESYRLLLGHWILSTGDKPMDKQLRFYEWLLIRKPNLYGPVPWARLNENWKTALSISSNPPSKLTKDSPAIYWYLSSKNPDIADAVIGLTLIRYSEGAIPLSSYPQRQQNDAIENMYVQHVNRVIVEGKGPASFLSYMAELNPGRLGPKD